MKLCSRVWKHFRYVGRSLRQVVLFLLTAFQRVCDGALDETRSLIIMFFRIHVLRNLASSSSGDRKARSFVTRPEIFGIMTEISDVGSRPSILHWISIGFLLKKHFCILHCIEHPKIPSWSRKFPVESRCCAPFDLLSWSLRIF